MRAAVGVIVLALVFVAASVQQQRDPAVSVIAEVSSDVEAAAAQVVSVTGEQLTPALGEEIMVIGGPSRVAVIGWAAGPAARCEIWIDGALVASYGESELGRPVSCVWPSERQDD